MQIIRVTNSDVKTIHHELTFTEDASKLNWNVDSKSNKVHRKFVDAAGNVCTAAASQGRGAIEDKKFMMGIKGGKYGKDGEGHERRLVERTIQPVKLWERTRYLLRHPPSRISTRHSTFESLTVTTRAAPPPLTFASSLGIFLRPARFGSVIKHCRDGAKHHPIVAEFARTRGNPHTDALLRLASLGLRRILKVIPLEKAREATDHVEAHIKKLDAEELERQST